MVTLPDNPVLWVIGKPDAAHFQHLSRLPGSVRAIIHAKPEEFAGDPDPDLILNGGFGRDIIQPLWPRFHKVVWYHSLMAGMEGQLFPELIHSTFPITNAAGVFAGSLAEFAITGMLYFAKSITRLQQQQQQQRWQTFDIHELRHAKVAIYGYGGIGQATAKLAKAFGMHVIAGRRRGHLSETDPHVDRVVATDEFDSILPEVDYLVMSAPLTPETRGRFGPAQIQALKSTAVIINIGRGPIIVESALIEALQQNAIRGAALDVFDVEPLPAGHAFYGLSNVLLSPHTADRTVTWLDDSMDRFLENFRRVQQGEELLAMVDKHAGY